MVIKHAEETSNCAMAWKYCVAEENVRFWRKQKELLFKGAFKPEDNFVDPSWGI